VNFVKIIAPLLNLIWIPQKAVKGKAAARVAKGAQTDADESMADCIAEVDDVTAGLDTEERDALPAVPATAPIAETVLRLRLRLDKSKKAEAAAIKEKEQMQTRLSDVEAQLELAKANVGDVVQLQSPLAQSAAKVNCELFPSNA
jgi:hypothetical protein